MRGLARRPRPRTAGCSCGGGTGPGWCAPSPRRADQRVDLAGQRLFVEVAGELGQRVALRLALAAFRLASPSCGCADRHRPRRWLGDSRGRCN